MKFIIDVQLPRRLAKQLPVLGTMRFILLTFPPGTEHRMKILRQ